MRRVLLLVLLALALPAMTWANSTVGFTNSGGTLSGGAGGFTLTGSTLIKVGSIKGSDLGTLSFTTGAFTSGDAQNGGILAPGGTFTITGNGMNGVPNGVIFSGTFSSVKPLQWILLGPGPSGNNIYSLVGTITNASGRSGATVQLTVGTGKGLFNGSIDLESGDTSLSTAVPEPGTLGLLGTGLLGIGGLMRRRVRIG